MVISIIRYDNGSSKLYHIFLLYLLHPFQASQERSGETVARSRRSADEVAIAAPFSRVKTPFDTAAQLY
jgi:hypothetical protein